MSRCGANDACYDRERHRSLSEVQQNCEHKTCPRNMFRESYNCYRMKSPVTNVYHDHQAITRPVSDAFAIRSTTTLKPFQAKSATSAVARVKSLYVRAVCSGTAKLLQRQHLNFRDDHFFGEDRYTLEGWGGVDGTHTCSTDDKPVKASTGRLEIWLLCRYLT